jgi:hypothetical protein
MATFRISQDIVRVDADFLRRSVKLPVVQVENSAGLFFRCISSNTALHRLVVADTYVALIGSAAAALRRTEIMKTLKQLKDDDWSKQLATLNYNESTRRYTRGIRAQALSFSPTVSIVAPRASNVESITVTVELSKPTKGLVMLLKPEHIEYLRNVVSAQLDIGMSSTLAHVRTRMDAANRVDTGVQNLTWSYRLNKYRAVFYPPDGRGNKRQRCEYLTESRESAATFVETGIRPIDSVVGGSDVELTSPAEESGTEVEDEVAASGIADRPSASIETREGGGPLSDIV